MRATSHPAPGPVQTPHRTLCEVRVRRPLTRSPKLRRWTKCRGPVTTYAYDALGERTSTTPPIGAATSYSYDQASELTRFDDGTNPTIDYTYAADGLRATKSKSSSTTQFTWDRSAGPATLLTKDSTEYIYDAGGLPLEQTDSSGTTYLHHDRLGSTRLSTASDGTVQATYDYDAHGQRTTTNGTTDTPFGYTGQYTETDTGLIYLRARYYDPTTGQFLTVDPLVAETGDAYGYANQDPTNTVDPSGLRSLRDIGAGIANAAAGFGDGASFGLSAWMRSRYAQIGVPDNVDYCSGAYGAARVVGAAEGSFAAAEGLTELVAAARAGRLAAKGGEEATTAGRAASAVDEAASPTAPFGRPGPDFEWRGPTDKGSWYNPKTGEYWRPDPNHPAPQGPHWDYRDPNGGKWRVYPDGRVEPKR